MTQTSASRWWLYQRERFPLLAHGPLVAAMSFGALGFASALEETLSTPLPAQVLSAWLGLLGFFFLLRVADEFKDYETDCRHRPYRAVPRGLVSLRELAVAAALVVALQIGLTVLQSLWLFLPLGIAWAWLLLMSWEFFVPDWLEARPMAYLFSHMLIMPLLMLYALAHQWVAVGQWQPLAALLLLPVALGTGLCIELGRKLRRPSDEEPGVDTYSALWGRPPAALAWLAATVVTLALMVIAASHAGAFNVALTTATLVALLAGVTVFLYLRDPESRAAKAFEGLSALTVLSVYLLLGATPWLSL